MEANNSSEMSMKNVLESLFKLISYALAILSYCILQIFQFYTIAKGSGQQLMACLELPSNANPIKEGLVFNMHWNGRMLQSKPTLRSGIRTMVKEHVMHLIKCF